MSSSVQHFAESSKVHERRVSQRLLPKSLIYVACGESNGGMVLNVSDDGMAISMAIAVGDEAYSHLDVRMNGLPQSIEVPGRMVWTTKSKKRAGIQLVDVSDTQRQQIREWMALEGVRDVNLRPRTVSDDVAASSAITADAVNPMVFAEPRSKLLDAFGGTAPETLGPPLPELFASQVEGEALPLPSQSFDNASKAAFRENEWDLASVTMVPRKKPKPEGLSTFALMLLWIAIPSFGIGILVGRRPLEQWLARGNAAGKSLSRSASSQRPSSSTPDISPVGHQADVKFSPELLSNLPINTERFDTDVFTPQPGEIYRSADSSGGVDSKLLNSMSTQEARAFQKANVRAIPAASGVKNDFDNADKSNLLTGNSAPLPISPAKPLAVSPGAITTGAPSHPASATEAVPGTIATAAQPQNKTVTPPAVAPNSFSSLSMRHESTSENSATARHNDVAGSAPPAVPAASTSVFAAASTSSTPANSNSNRSAAPDAALKNGAATLSASSTTASLATPVASSSAAVPPSVAAPVAGNVPPKPAPLSVQPALHGVMSIARNTDQAFVLKLPAESVPGGGTASMRMQRFVMVPQKSRWHHHAAIAKLTVGELLTDVAPEKPDAKVQPRSGDTVTVRAFVDKDGAVRDLKPVSGRFALMPRVMRTVREWQFDQTLVDGKPVESEVNVTVEYRGAN